MAKHHHHHGRNTAASTNSGQSDPTPKPHPTTQSAPATQSAPTTQSDPNITWVSPFFSGNWSTPGDWSPNHVPNSDDNVTIALTPGTEYTVFYNTSLQPNIPKLTIDSATATLQFRPDQVLNVGTLTDLILGTIDISNAAFLTTAALSVGPGAVIAVANSGQLAVASGDSANQGTIESTAGVGTVSGTIVGTGTVEAVGATLLLPDNLQASDLSYQVSASGSSTLDMGGTVPADLLHLGAPAFTFQGAAGEFLFSNSATVSANVAGMNVGTSDTNPTNLVGLAGSLTVSGSDAFIGTSATVTLTNGTITDTLDLSSITGDTSGTWFVNTDIIGATTDVFLSVVCFAVGTHIRTPNGKKPVESLTPGDLVFTFADGQLSPQPVKWIGRRRIDLTAHPRPETVAPVRVQRDAFAENVPHTDLLLSPDHAIFVDGKLICARQLINGTTIWQEKGFSSIEYFHVELDTHAILLAEGLPAESYLNTGNQGFFANSDEPLVLHPDLTDETDYPTRQAGSCAPFVWDEATVRPIWQQLADRAAAIGRPVPQQATTTDADLRLFGKYRTVKPIYGDSSLVIFNLPRGANEVRLLSRAQSPAEARPWLDDRRRLGIRVKRIVLRGVDELHEIPMDHPGLTNGWWNIERDGQMMNRWTDGDAVVPLPKMGGPVMLELHLAGQMIYAVEAELESQSAPRRVNVAA